MNKVRKGSHNFSILQGKAKRCYFSDTETGPLERHHIYYGSGMRQISDRHGFWVWLAPEWHRGTQGVHGKDGHKVDLLLKRDCQRKFEETHSREEWMMIIGKNYLLTAQGGAAVEGCCAKQSGKQEDEKPQTEAPAEQGMRSGFAKQSADSVDNDGFYLLEG